MKKENRVPLTERQALFDAILDSIIVINERGIIQDVNKATEKLFGYDRDELLDENIKVLMDTDDASNHDNHLKRYLETGRAKILGIGREVIAKKKSGILFYAFLSIARYESQDKTMFVGSLRDISDQVQKILSLEYQALHDDLTKLASRRLLDQKLEHAISNSMRMDLKFHIVYIDLDDFKPINDELGHHTGDEVLKLVAKRLTATFRSNDVCARVGGDEFIVLCEPSEVENDERILMDKVAEALRKPLHIDKKEVCLSASVGISTFPDDATTSNELIRIADQNMYECKSRKGKHGTR